jgi:hypothetical protein
MFVFGASIERPEGTAYAGDIITLTGVPDTIAVGDTHRPCESVEQPWLHLWCLQPIDGLCRKQWSTGGSKKVSLPRQDPRQIVCRDGQ